MSLGERLGCGKCSSVEKPEDGDTDREDGGKLHFEWIDRVVDGNGRFEVLLRMLKVTKLMMNGVDGRNRGGFIT